MHYSGDAHEPPTPEQLAAWQRRSGPPDNEVPGPLAWAALLGRGPDVAVALTGAAAYSSGLRLEVSVRARTSTHDLFDAVEGHRTGRDRLLLGVEFADGRCATLNPGGWSPDEPAADAPSLRSGGGTGRDRAVDLTLFLHPLPPPGPLAVLCSWPGRGVPESRVELAGAAITAAAGQVQVLWPPAPPERGHPEPPPPPDVPDGGWFARVLDR